MATLQGAQLPFGFKVTAQRWNPETREVELTLEAQPWRPAFVRFFLGATAQAARRNGLSPCQPKVALLIGRALLELNVSAAKEALGL